MSIASVDTKTGEIINKIFKTPYGERERYYIESGRPEADIWKHEINNKGIKELVKTGTTNVYQKIQEGYEDTKIENIIARVTAGDTSMLRANGQWIDTTEIPNNLIEARQAIQKMENMWQELPSKIKENYNFNIDEFIAKSGSEQWMIDMGFIKKEVKAEPKAEVKTEPKAEVKTEAKGEAEA